MADHGYAVRKYLILLVIRKKWCNFIKYGLISPFFNSFCHSCVSTRGRRQWIGQSAVGGGEMVIAVMH